MISINNLTIEYSGRFIFNDVSFNINKNEKIGLIGRNGSGKTTLLRLIYGAEKPQSGIITKPNDLKIGYLPQEGITLSNRVLFEEVKSSLTEITSIENQIKEITKKIENRQDYASEEFLRLTQKLSEITHRFDVLGGYNLDGEIEKVLKGLGFERDEFWRRSNEFSGGWQMRIELAKILLQRPDCILLDEPTNHLDIDSIQWLENYLKNYESSVVIVSHDKSFLDNVTQKTIEISMGKLYIMNLKYSEFLKAREEQKQQIYNQYKAQQKEIEQIERFIERFRYKATLASRVQSRIKQLEKKELIQLDEEDNSEIVVKFPEVPRSGSVVVSVKGLTKRYGEKLVLRNIDFELNRGDKVAFVGKNGEGKTTFTKILAGLEEFEGQIEYGINVRIGYYSQNQADLLESEDTVYDVIDRVATGEMRTKIRSLLGAFLFSGDSIYKKVKVLSGGEKSRLALARLLLEPVNLLLLDEPTNHLDMIAKRVLKNALADFGGSLVIVSHDRDFLTGITTKTYLFKNKGIKEYLGDISSFINSYNIENLAELNRSDQSSKNQSISDKSFSGKDKIKREEQKKLQREISSAQKKIKRIEEEISSIEGDIIKIEEEFANPKIMNDYELMNQKTSIYNQLKKEIDEKYQEWEDLHKHLERIEGTFGK